MVGAQHCEVVGLRAPRREAHLVRAGPEAAGDPLAGLIERRARFPSPAVRAARVAEAESQKGHHRVDDLGANRGGGGVVEVEGIRHPAK